MIFKDRLDAARRLAPYLEKYKGDNGVILAVPRGGVPIGHYLAVTHHLPLELMLAKKIGHPQSEELAVGAVSLEGHIVDERFHLPSTYIDAQVRKITESLKQRYRLFMGDRQPPELKGKTVIIVDDGIATGNTLRAAIRLIRQKEPKRIVVAVPVAPFETAEKMKQEVDEFICLYAPTEFFGVGQFYDDFSEVSDDEVIRLLKEVNKIAA